MSRRRILLTGSILIIAVMAVIGTTLLVGARKKAASSTGIWQLSTDIIYDETLEKSMDALEQSGVACALWKVQKNQLVKNPDFGRTLEVVKHFCNTSTGNISSNLFIPLFKRS